MNYFYIVWYYYFVLISNVVWSVDELVVVFDVSFDDVIFFVVDVEGKVMLDGVIDVMFVGVEFLVWIVIVFVVIKEVEDLVVLLVFNMEDIFGFVDEIFVVWSFDVVEVCVILVELVVDKIDMEDDFLEGVVVLMSEVFKLLNIYVVIYSKKKIFYGNSLYCIIWLIVNYLRYRDMSYCNF